MTSRGHRPEPLTPEERALADRLGRSDASPPPALDAAILAAARAAVSGAAAQPGAGPEDAGPDAPTPTSPAHARTPARRRRRWPVGFGIAASLLVAIGVAWQLRPLPETRPEVWSEAPEPAPRMQRATAIDAPAQQDGQPAANDTSASPPSDGRGTEAMPAPAAMDAAPAAQDASRAPPAPPPSPAPLAAPPPAPTLAPVADTGATMEREDAPRPPRAARAGTPQDTAIGHRTSPAPAASPVAVGDLSTAPAAFPSAQRSTSGRAVSEGLAPPPAPAAARERTAQEAARVQVPQRPPAASAHAQRVPALQDQAPEDEPPASADSPEVRDAWLARVRELLDAGDIQAARDSLAEFHRRYPQAELSPDLRALLD
ncbi:hypothetical protein LDO26_09390 [Luteimonas sp. BDR2-5]|uniref:hypothetical protein n=1 Tax=Proluteimonas luteida TaxID=2878685 RepID=UPI001E5F2D0B|nr:hypothetical protein [Luteimonas sp. BDR2-5]MCD9028421.1 hypothetical protein [Luteimonas sp. BDR2-5]